MPGAWSPAPPRRFCRRATTSRFPAASACGECWGGCLRPWDQQPALDPTPPPPGCAPTHASRTPCLLHPLVPTALGPGGDLGQGKGQPPPQPRFPHTRVPPQGGQELGLWEGGSRWRSQGGLPGGGGPGEGAGALTTCSALRPSYPGCLGSAPACPHASRPSQSALDASLGGGGEEGAPSGTPGRPAICPRSLSQSQPPTADPAASRVPGAGQQPGLWCVTHGGGCDSGQGYTHAHTHTQGCSHTRARAHTPQQLSAARQFHISQYSPSRAGPPGAGGKSEAAQWCKEGHTGARGGGLWTSGLARSGSGPACPGEVGAPRSGPHPFPCPQRPSPSLGPGAPGQGPRQGCWLAAGAGAAGPTPGTSSESGARSSSPHGAQGHL